MYKTAKVVIILVCWAMVMGLTLLWDKVKGGKHDKRKTNNNERKISLGIKRQYR